MLDDQLIKNNLGIVFAVLIFDYVLKAIALWISAKKDSKVWFTLLLLLNTAGILPLFYIFYFSKQNTVKTESTKNKKE